MVMAITLYGIAQWIACIFLTQQLAKAKGYHTDMWTIGAMVLGPIVLLALVGSPLFEENHYWKGRDR